MSIDELEAHLNILVDIQGSPELTSNAFSTINSIIAHLYDIQQSYPFWVGQLAANESPSTLDFTATPSTDIVALERSIDDAQVKHEALNIQKNA